MKSIKGMARNMNYDSRGWLRSAKALILTLLIMFASRPCIAQVDIDIDITDMLSVDDALTVTLPLSESIFDDDFEIDSLLLKYDIDIDLALGTVTEEEVWGDPVRNPQIRCNRASNLFGPVRHNEDGSIRWHRGFDYYAPVGTAVYSVGRGVVSLVQTHPDYGLCILITHKRPGKTYYSFYAHLSSVSVEYGSNVYRGSVIGRSGTTGNASGLAAEEQHLHFEYRTSPKHSDRKQKNPNEIVKTKFYSADPKNHWQANVGVVKKQSKSSFE